MGVTMRQTLHLADLAATQQFAMTVARLLGPGDVILLTGVLGAVETTFTHDLAHGLSIQAHITSTTVILSRHHDHPCYRLSMLHVDAYRLTNKDELSSLDLETSLDNSVVVIEWGRGMAEALATSHLDIELQRPGVASDQLLTDFSDTDVDEHR